MKYYIAEDDKIERMLENGARMKQTDEEKSTLSYNGNNFIVSTPYLKRLMPSGYDGRTIESLTGMGIGAAINTAKPLSTYAKLSQTDEEKYKPVYKPRSPRRLFSNFD